MITTPIRLEGCVVQRCSTWRGPLECSSARTAAESGFPFATPIPRLRVKPSWRLNPSSVPIDPRPRRWLLLLVVVEPHLATRRFGCHVRWRGSVTHLLSFSPLSSSSSSSSSLVLLPVVLFSFFLSSFIFVNLPSLVFICVSMHTFASALYVVYAVYNYMIQSPLVRVCGFVAFCYHGSDSHTHHVFHNEGRYSVKLISRKGFFMV